MPVERRGSQPTSATNDGADARSFAASEDATEQRSCPRANRGVNNGGSTSSARLDRPLDVHPLSRRRIVKLDQLSADACTASVRRNDSIEAQHHGCVAFQSARRCDAADVSVDAGIAVLALIDDGCTERIAHPGVGAGQRVIEANTECDVRRYRKAETPPSDWRGNYSNQQEGQINERARIFVSDGMLQHW